MLFSSSVFWLFYVIVVLILVSNQSIFKSLKIQNITLLSASYYFYAFWDWKFLGLIIFVSLQTFILGGLIERIAKYQKIFLGLSVIINIVILGYFKYLNFFAKELLDLLELAPSYTLAHIILPVGISFYIFQSLTYVIDIYFKKLSPEKNIVNYFTYIAFFPQLVAGPIERATALLPQFRELKTVNVENFYNGTKIIIIGLFFKIFIADSLAESIDWIFLHYRELDGGTLLLGDIYFSIQIYGDFCGYSLIAIGVAKIIGFDLMRNFNTPYFSISIQDFWRRWHISLSTFFRDYVYIPLGGSRVSALLNIRNLMITFVLSGIWHGANWTFIFWGGTHGALLVLQKHLGGVVPKRGGGGGGLLILQKHLRWKVPKFIGWATTLSVVLILWVFFRAESITDAWTYITRMVSDISIPHEHRSGLVFVLYSFAIDTLLLYYGETGKTFLYNSLAEALILGLMLLVTLGTLHDVTPNFIYFQF